MFLSSLVVSKRKSVALEDKKTHEKEETMKTNLG